MPQAGQSVPITNVQVARSARRSRALMGQPFPALRSRTVPVSRRPELAGQPDTPKQGGFFRGVWGVGRCLEQILRRELMTDIAITTFEERDIA
jgi:hypothetical protein